MDPVDFSSYIHFEATGDSEVDCDPNMGGYACEIARVGGDDDDDKKENEEKDEVYGTSYCEDDEMQEEHQKTFVSFDSGQELVDEMEKNRLFWEACLAS